MPFNSPDLPSIHPAARVCDWAAMSFYPAAWTKAAPPLPEKTANIILPVRWIIVFWTLSALNRKR